jgi:ribonuclease PH
MRADGRGPDALRPVRIERGYLRFAEGSALIDMGATRVLCAATIEAQVPEHRRGTGRGWVTAEYSMLPRSSPVRVRRESVDGRLKGRTHEIKRLVGRSLRAVVDLEALGERSVLLDCDVIQADGGTRTAAINGSAVALYDALSSLGLPRHPMRELATAVSVGLVGGEPRLDLDYAEDASASVDLNVVVAASGRFIEVQGSAEKEPYSDRDLDLMLGCARRGLAELLRLQRAALGLEP